MIRCSLFVCVAKTTQKVFAHRWAPLVASHILITAFMFGFYARSTLRSVLCATDKTEHCVREWVSASGGWAAVAVAIITLLFLRKQIISQQEQISQADKHQRIAFEIELRREKLLAQRVEKIASEARLMIRNADGTLRRLEPGEWLNKILEVLDGEVIERFESEIAFPRNMRGKTVAKIARDGLVGDIARFEAAPTHIANFFEFILEQAQEFLADVRHKTTPEQ